ncbi:flagellar motor switch protein FliN [Buchnera aphidicola (Aphis helianthi)]|uniref:Flagellar motor switch protein FliN n=1 Tax=Buchnera aphidicola (Aphis helianthi) TaxID=2315802 RepID=A0A4D6XIH4_9GAMM|nr:flagellar motor switch protein FliN [Buchnera aphidicola]QCI16916.1 flagellar motor switch protein FliN [Buchnera aphidicola (Aphis helianthi)]
MNKLKKKPNFDKIDRVIQSSNNDIDNNDIDNNDIDNNDIDNNDIDNNDIDNNDIDNSKEKKSVKSEEILNNKKIIFDIPINITIELGRSKIKIKELLNFSKGSMFILNRQKEDPLKIFANGKLVAFGEVVISDNTYGIRIISIKNSLNTMN